MDNLGMILDKFFDYAENYEEVSISTSMQTQNKFRLKEIAASKGMTMGEVIEEMMEVYDRHQYLGKCRY